MDLMKFVRDHLPGSRIPRWTSAKYDPGAILTPKDLRYKGHLRDVLGDTGDEWAIERAPGSIVYGTLSGSRAAKGGFNLLGLVNVGASGGRTVEANFEVTDVVGALFASESQLTVHPRLNGLRQQEPQQWALINGQFVVTEAFHAKGFTVTFSVKGQGGGSVDVKEIVRFDVSATAGVDWTSAGKLVVTNNIDVPFAVRGFKV